MRILVTGGAGYIGSFTVRALQEAGHEVVVYDNLVFGHPEAVTAQLIVGDLADSARLDQCLAEGSFDGIAHFGAFIESGESMKDAAKFFGNNTGNAINLLNAAVRHGIRLFVFSSSAAVYSEGAEMPVKETAPREPASAYGETKLLVERMLPWYELVHGLRSVSLRYFNAAGGALDGSMGQDHEPASHLITRAIQRALGLCDRFVLNGDDYATPDGTCIRDYIHVLDLASAHLDALEYLGNAGQNEIFNVGTGRGYSNWEVIRAVKAASGVDFPVEIGPRRPGDAAELVADVSRLRRTLAWEPKYSDLETIVESAWRWHSQHRHGYAAEESG